jgi:hypothetical protein
VSEEPLAPRRGIPSGRGPRTVCWRQGSGADGLPFICPFPSAIAEGRRLALPPDGRRHLQGASHRSDGTVLDTRRPPRCRPGSLRSWGGSRRNPTPVPSSQYCEFGSSGILTRGWHQRPWAPFSSSSAFFSLLPFFCLPGELRAFALLGAPLLPLPSGAPLLPRHPGATGERHFPPLPLREAER